MQRKLPTLVFGENHSDPITNKMICKLIPKLKEIGYEAFYDESRPGHFRNKKITVEGLYQIYADTLEMIKFNFLIAQPGSIENVIGKSINFNDEQPIANMLAQMDKSSPQYKDIQEFLKEMDNQIHIDELMELFQLPKTIIQNKIDYRGVDNWLGSTLTEMLMKLHEALPKSTFTNIKQANIFYLYLATALMNSLRNPALANAYIETNQSIFARVGRAHMAGIQEILIKKLGDDAARNGFIFLNLDSKGLGEVNTPLGYIHIDTRKKSDDEIVNFIISLVKGKIMAATLDSSKVSCVGLRENSLFNPSLGSRVDSCHLNNSTVTNMNLINLT